jgi:C-terminal processing protease CtpA/Prc
MVFMNFIFNIKNKHGLIKVISFLILLPLVWSCEKAILEEPVKDSPTQNFEYLWNDLNQRYAFFEYKNVNWQSIHNQYSARITDKTNQYELFNYLFDMLSELKDGHVNLISPFNISRFEIDLLGKNNYNHRLIRENYLSDKYYITGPFTHDFLRGTNIGYIRYESFSDYVSTYSMDFVLARFHNADGIILDLRQNGGGSITNVFSILSHFVDVKTELYHSYIKNGPERDDFSDAQPAYANPEGQYSFTYKPVKVLIDRGSFSASSFFSLACKAIPNIELVGDSTGGGLGAPTAGQLPNGWTYRFSASKTLSLDQQNYENGVPPDVYAILDDTNVLLGKDDVIDKSVERILNP